MEGAGQPAPAPVRTRAAALRPGLYVVATPIGNLGDISRRAIETLEQVELVLCEDTRMTGKLFGLLGIQARRMAFHEHNERDLTAQMVERMAQGAALALVSDAGTPLVSDPGYRLVRATLAAGLGVYAVPGASSLTAALSIAGQPSDRVLFVGFAPAKTAARQSWIADWARISASVVMFETAPRLLACLEDMAAALGADRRASICREITKMHESVVSASLQELISQIGQTPVRGEIVLVIAPPDCAPVAENLEDRLAALLDGPLATASTRDAAEQASVLLGVPKRDIYQLILTLRS